MAKGFSITGSIPSAKKFAAKIEALQFAALERQALAVKESTLLVHENAVKLIQDNADGSPQIRYKPKRVVAVSKPGDPPNADRGRLAQSIKFEIEGKGLVGRVGSNLKYAKALEFGTKIMEARPWLSVALSQAAKEVAEIFRRSIKGIVK